MKSLRFRSLKNIVHEINYLPTYIYNFANGTNFANFKRGIHEKQFIKLPSYVCMYLHIGTFITM
jgi:hypothetical protein